MTNPRKPDHPVNSLFIDRWSPRAFTGETISKQSLLTVLEAARWAPSAYNFQPWRFVWALRDTSAWQPIFDALVPFNQSWAKNASALIVIASKQDAQFPGQDSPGANPWSSFDCGAAWASLAFQANFSGLAAHALAGFEPEKLKAAIALPDGFAIQTVVVLGKVGDKQVLPESLQQRETPNARTPLSEMASEGIFSH